MATVSELLDRFVTNSKGRFEESERDFVPGIAQTRRRQRSFPRRVQR